jgi:hypothetical protein
VKRRIVLALALIVGMLGVPAQAQSGGSVMVYLQWEESTESFRVRVNTSAGVVNLGGPSAVAGPALSPNESKVAYTGEVGDKSDGLYAVFVVNRNNGNVSQISPAAFGEFDPAWSPDGDEIVASQNPNGSYEVWTCCRLVVYDSNGGQNRILTDNIGAIHPDWSPNGDTIAFQTPDGILTIPAGGGSPSLLIPGGRDPAYNPAGSHIAYVLRSGSQFQLRVRHISSSADQVIYTTNGRLEAPVWVNDEIMFLEFFGEGLEGRGTTNVQRIPGGGGPVATVFGSSAPVVGLDGALAPVPDQCPSGRNCDVVAFQDSGGRFHLWDMVASPHGTNSFFYGNPGDVPFSGDWNCDGVETLGLYRRSDGFVYLRNSNTEGIADITFFFGNPGDLPIAGDFNNDGCDTVSIYRPSEARFYIINQLGQNGGGLGFAEYSFLFGNPGDKPFIGDFNGDGIDTPGLHRESSGLVYFRDTNTQGIADFAFIYGNPGDKIVAGDWNGDGIDTVGVYRPSTGFFFIRNTNTEGIADATLPAGAYTGTVAINP